MIRILAQLSLIAAMFVANLLVGVRTWTHLTSSLSIRTDTIVRTPAFQKEDIAQTAKLAPLASFSETLAHPLFFEGRRFAVVEPAPTQAPAAPPKAPAPAQPKPAARADQFKLLGVMLSGPERRALIEGPSMLPNWYTEGSKIRDWTISQVASNRVVLTFADQNAVLDLYPSSEPN